MILRNMAENSLPQQRICFTAVRQKGKHCERDAVPAALRKGVKNVFRINCQQQKEEPVP